MKSFAIDSCFMGFLAGILYLLPKSVGDWLLFAILIGIPVIAAWVASALFLVTEFKNSIRNAKIKYRRLNYIDDNVLRAINPEIKWWHYLALCFAPYFLTIYFWLKFRKQITRLFDVILYQNKNDYRGRRIESMGVFTVGIDLNQHI